ncbi:putative UPF0481 protein [Camellia lanceoleosa]|uniref:UPF0481 protein n=1 Tax=Camellia lanceoleosa TaxID=1840588 RepID=A0ACC0HHF7_9ERIC|nr:putative UPF0481 protein [Camellia lanceoleosa]
MTKMDLDLEIIEIALTFLQFNAPEQKLEAPREISINNIKHLLQLVHSCWCFKFAEMNRNETEKQLEFINSATEPQELGIQFKKAEETNLFDIKFISGLLEIPLLTIEAEVGESFFTNLVAFELCPSYHEPRYVCDYTVFMNCLINSSEDVRLLHCSGIIESWVGDDAELYSMWHKLHNITLTDTKKFSYPQVFNDVNNHYPLEVALIKDTLSNDFEFDWEVAMRSLKGFNSNLGNDVDLFSQQEYDMPNCTSSIRNLANFSSIEDVCAIGGDKGGDISNCGPSKQNRE